MGRFKIAVAAAAASIVMLGLGVTPEQAADNGSSNGEVGTYGACSACWYYRSTVRGADTHFKVGSTQSNYNGTGSTITSTFSAKVSGTATATFSGSVNVGGNIKLVSISGQFGISASASMTASLGNEVTISIPAGKYGNADYGVWRAYVEGYEDYTTNTCAVTQPKATTTYGPYKVGWNTWIS